MKKMFFSITVLLLSALITFSSAIDADARAGGGKSFGSKGFSSRPTPNYQRTTPQQAQPRDTFQQQQRQPYTPPPQAQSGGFLRSMAGGLLGGFIGGMLFRSIAGAGSGMGGLGQSGIGIFEIILIAGIAFMIYRFVKKRREADNLALQSSGGYQQFAEPEQNNYISDSEQGLMHIKQMDYSFDEVKFKQFVEDSFFKFQSAWINKDLSSLTHIMTEEVRAGFQAELNDLILKKHTNKLENVAIRSIEIVDAWQESGQDFITTMITASMLDYTTDDSGNMISGSKSDSIKFEELWTFTRSVGNNPWKLSMIEQK